MPREPDPTRTSVSARILVAEDHLDSRHALCTLLEAFGFEVLVAADGREAVDVARRDRPDLILMDMMMPKVDGFDATRTLRADNRTASIPIIAVTAMEGADRLARRAGVDDFVRKPIDTGLLLDKIREQIGRPSGAVDAGNGSRARHGR